MGHTNRSSKIEGFQIDLVSYFGILFGRASGKKDIGMVCRYIGILVYRAYGV